MRFNLIDIECEIVSESVKAVQIWDGTSYDNDGGFATRKTVWLPRSQIEIIEDGRTATVTMPEWLATEKGLI